MQLLPLWLETAPRQQGKKGGAMRYQWFKCPYCGMRHPQLLQGRAAAARVPHEHEVGSSNLPPATNYHYDLKLN